MKVLFIPVSGKLGIGEYSRGLIFAGELIRQYQGISVSFIVSCEAPYASSCPYPVFLTSQSPTLCSDEVCDIIERYAPQIVVFVSAGRAKQLKFAKQMGAKTVFVSQHNKKRAQGLNLSRLKYIDLHLVDQYPIFIAELTAWQRFKLWLFNKPAPLCVGSVFAQATNDENAQLLAAYGLEKGLYIFVSAGSGAHQTVNGEYVSDLFFEAVKGFASPSLKVVQVFGSIYPKALPSNEHVVCLPSLENAGFIGLLASSQCALINGGATLGQAMSLQKPCVSVPIAKDQFQRVTAASQSGFCLSADPNKAAVVNALGRLLLPETQDAMHDALAQSGVMADQSLKHVGQLILSLVKA